MAKKKLNAPVTVTTILEEEQHDALRDFAFRERIPMAELVRKAVDDLLANANSLAVDDTDNSEMVTRVVVALSETFPSFGGGNMSGCNFNPLVSALKDEPPMFAAGVNIEQVVRFVLQEATK